jgi:Domain of unknown function (DUF222)
METRSLDQLGDEIAELSAHLDAATARLLDLIREFDIRRGWNTGFPSCAAWLGWRVGLEIGAARERVRVARALETLPRLAGALARGEFSYAKVRALTRVATPGEEERLLAIGRAGTAEHVERIVRGWRRMDRKQEMREAALQHAGRALHVYQNEDGMVTVRGRLTPEAGALLVQALAAAREALYQKARAQTLNAVEPNADPPTMAQQQADALTLLAETSLHHGMDPGAPGERYQVVVHVDAAVLADAEAPGQSVFEEGARSRGNVAAPGLRREPSGDAARRRRACRGGRGQDPHDPARVEAGAAPPGPPLSLSGLHGPLLPGASHPSLGARGAHDALESHAPLSPPPSCGSRGGISGRSAAGWRASVPGSGRSGSFPLSRLLARCRTIRRRLCERGTSPRDCDCTRTRRRPGGSASA